MKVYTKTGDKGKTSLYDGKRIYKTSLIFEVLGEIDELSSRIGVLYALTNKKYIYLKEIQQTLQDINSNIATLNKEKKKLPKIEENHINKLEERIDTMDKVLPKLTQFILAGSYTDDAQCHLCRTQARKAERFLWKLDQSINLEFVQKGEILDLTSIRIDSVILKFMNRLSDYFFVLARFLENEHNRGWKLI